MIIGITGLIGTGKSTISKILEDCGAVVHNADDYVHALYKDKELLRVIASHFDDVDVNNFNRNSLMDSLKGRPERRALLESIIHPRVRKSQLDFLNQHKDQDIIVLDVPLLFETKAEDLCDEVWVTTCSPETQRKRVLARDAFDEEKLNVILKWQGDDAYKKERATHVIDTDKPLVELVKDVQQLIRYKA